MMQELETPIASVVIATHNRPDSLFRLLQVIKSQDLDAIEVIVVDDNSDSSCLERCGNFWPALDPRFKLLNLPATISRRSPAVTRNYGIQQARGHFVAFCDDDDMWVRDDHLRAAVTALSKYDADFFIGNMRTAAEGTVKNFNWYEIGMKKLKSSRTAKLSEPDLYVVDGRARADFLANRTPHANTMVIAKTLFDFAGMYWERVVFAEDHEMAYRLFDKAKRILFRSTVVAELDVGEHDSVARSHSADERSMFGTLASLRAATLISDPALRRRLRADRAWRIVELARSQAAAGNSRAAREFALEAFKIHPSGAALHLLLRGGR